MLIAEVLLIANRKAENVWSSIFFRVVVDFTRVGGGGVLGIAR